MLGLEMLPILGLNFAIEARLVLIEEWEVLEAVVDGAFETLSDTVKFSIVPVFGVLVDVELAAFIAVGVLCEM